MKVLQITILSMMRALRAVFCWTLHQEIIFRTAPDLLTSIMALQSRLERRSSRGVGPRRPEGPYHVLRPSNRLVTHIRVRTAGPLIMDRPHELLPTPTPRISVLRGARIGQNASLCWRAIYSGQRSGHC